MKHTKQVAKLKGYIPLLKAIDTAIDALDKYDRADGYGDMAQNFEDACRERETKRLYELIKADLKALTKGSSV